MRLSVEVRREQCGFAKAVVLLPPTSYPNVLAAIITTAIAVVGYWLTGQLKSEERSQ